MSEEKKTEVEELSDDQLDVISGGYIYHNKQGMWEAIDLTGEVIGTFNDKEDAIELANVSKSLPYEINIHQLGGLREAYKEFERRRRSRG